MATKFLYIDDDQNARGIVKMIQDEELTFEVEEPQSWNEQIEYLIENNNLKRFDGLLLDLKLEFNDEDGSSTEKKKDSEKTKKIKFTGADLAQAIRTKIKSDSAISDLPIFLCSTDKAFMSYFDRTSYDLFDRKLDKNRDFSNKERDKKIFVEYSKAYKYLNKTSNLEKVLNKFIGEKEELTILQSEYDKCKTPHERIYLLDRYFLRPNDGILINEDLIAIRLGINRQESPDWEKFKNEILSNYSYNGLLSDYYKRWWNQEFLTNFKEKYNLNLKILDAEERIEGIKRNVGNFNLIPQQKVPNQEFTSFWYKCFLSDYPLDVLDGLKIMETPRYSWLEQNYISKAYMMSDERDKVKILSLLGPNEKNSFENLD